MRKILLISIPLFILITLAISNPSKSEYIEWANRQVIGEKDNLFSIVGNAIVSPIIDEATTIDNYYLFTVYKTTNLDGSVYKTLGIYRSFIFISKSEGYINISNTYSGTNQTHSSNTSSNINSLVQGAGAKVSSFIDTASKAINNNLESVQTQPVVTSTDELDVGGTITEGAIYNTYSNGRYGFTIDYPNQFDIGMPPANGDGLHFTSKDGKAELVAYGSNNVMDKNAESLYNTELVTIKNVSYKFFKDNWFVISWAENGTVYYTRTIVGEGSMNSLKFSCPEEQLDQYHDVIEHISKSFTKGNIEVAN